MGEVDEAHQAHGDGQADRHDEQHHAGGKPAEHDAGDVDAENHERSPERRAQAARDSVSSGATPRGHRLSDLAEEWPALRRRPGDRYKANSLTVPESADAPFARLRARAAYACLRAHRAARVRRQPHAYNSSARKDRSSAPCRGPSRRRSCRSSSDAACRRCPSPPRQILVHDDVAGRRDRSRSARAGC